MENLIPEFELTIKKCRTIEDCQQTLKSILKKLNIQSYTFTYFAKHPNSANKLFYDEASSDMQRWHQHYHEQNYDRLDSTVVKSYRGSFPIIWETHKQLANATSDLERQMRQDSINYGIEKGISIPLHGCDHDFSELVVRQRFGEDCLTNAGELRWPLLAITLIYYTHIKKLLVKKAKSPQEKYQLTAREYQCLLLSAKRLSTQEIAEQLCITPRTVHFHMQRLNKKLGTHNKFESITKALEEKLLIL